MFSIKTFFKLAILMLTLVSCGGGSGGGDGIPFFAGRYRVNLSILGDNCGLGLPATLSATHTVNQDGQRIVLDSGSVVLTGSVNEERDGFIVTNQSSDNQCVTRTGIGYRISDRANADYTTVFLIEVTCGRRTCEGTYGGTANTIR